MKAVNNGKIPDINSAWNYLKDCENRKLFDKILQDLENEKIDFKLKNEDQIVSSINRKL